MPAPRAARGTPAACGRHPLGPTRRPRPGAPAAPRDGKAGAPPAAGGPPACAAASPPAPGKRGRSCRRIRPLRWRFAGDALWPTPHAGGQQGHRIRTPACPRLGPRPGQPPARPANRQARLSGPAARRKASERRCVPGRLGGPAPRKRATINCSSRAATSAGVARQAGQTGLARSGHQAASGWLQGGARKLPSSQAPAQSPLSFLHGRQGAAHTCVFAPVLLPAKQAAGLRQCRPAMGRKAGQGASLWQTGQWLAGAGGQAGPMRGCGCWWRAWRAGAKPDTRLAPCSRATINCSSRAATSAGVAR